MDYVDDKVEIPTKPLHYPRNPIDRGFEHTLADGRVVEEYVVDGEVERPLNSTSVSAQRRVDELCAKHGLARYVIDDHYGFQPRCPGPRPHDRLVAPTSPMVGSFFDGGIGAGLSDQRRIVVTPCYRHEKFGNRLLIWNIRVLF